ncbi:ABC transporter permease [Actinoplanes friuliensis]|uniref:Putative permease n=1 Tax=Actinoplanes friuliensis DSM 7358 TaxID=1246995 RepID=U5W2Z7_9ACTN|nr:ABC transporter permease [Actinoplanes friuliensis]AGZ43504.1 putative permease [Actinoplanes friuliensis DSM 7358]
MSLAWSMVRHRFAAFAGTFVAIALGVAVVAGSTTIWASSQPQTPARLAAAPVLVHSPSVGDTESGYPEYRSWTTAEATGLAQRLAAVPGVTAAIADPSFYVQRVVAGRATGDPEAARTEGHAWSSAVLGGYRLSAGAAPARPGEVALAGAAPGSRIEVLTARGPATWTVTGTTDGPGLYVADTAATALASGVRVIGLTVSGEPESIAAAARTAVGADGTVLSGSARDALEPESVTRIRWLGAQLLIAMVFLGTFVAVFVVASTCALSAAQRRREIGLLRAVGATGGQVIRMMYAETLVVALLGGVAGVVLGAVTAPLLAAPLVSAGLEPAGFTVTLQPVALGAAFVLGIVVALIGVWAAARRSSRVPALDALREAAIEPRPMTLLRWIAGPLAAAGGGALLVALPNLDAQAQSSATLGGAMLLLVGAALLAPVVIGPLVRLGTWPWRHGASGMLLREGTLTGTRRVASTAAPVLLAVGFAVLFTGTVATISDSAGVDAAAEVPAALVAAPDGTPGLSQAAVTGQPGDARFPTRLLVTRDGKTTGYDAVGTDQVDGVVTSTDLGPTLDVRFADGTTASLPVTAVRDDAPAPILLPRELVLRHDPGALAEAVLLTGPAAPAAGLQVLSARDYVQIEIDEEGDIIDIFLVVLLGLGVGYTGLAVANTLLMATAARRTEFRALRLAGGGTGHVLRVTSGEAFLAVVTGTLLGGSVSLICLLAARRSIERELGQAIDLVVPWGQTAVVVAVCAVVAVLAAGAPVLRAGAGSR